MRKTIVTALIALFVMLALVSCDNMAAGAGGGGGKAGYTADGRELVELKINISGTEGISRSINATNAVEADFVEVVFKNGTDYFRTDARYTNGMEIGIRVTAGTYDKDSAVILIGKKDGTTYKLLAIATPAGSVTLPVPSGQTNKLSFTVTSLVANLNANAATPAFVINTTTGAISTSPFVTPTDKTKQGLFDDTDSTSVCFQVPKNIASITASLTITGFSDVVKDVLVVTDNAGTPLTAAATPELKFNSNGDATTITPTITTATTGFSNTDKAYNFNFTFGTPNAEGKYIITFDIPVVAFSNASGSGSESHIWHIRGGTSATKTQPDFDGKKEEGVALAVATNPNPFYSVVVQPTP